jgi:catechol 2,3-dioxygenase-like lactoylglutathione lyase family enzyme
MIDHLGMPVRDYARSRAFYLAALEPLGVGAVMEVNAPGFTGLGLGRDGKPSFWIHEGEPFDGMHLALSAETRAQVDAFHRAALAAGATDNGPPGLRPHYHPN